MTKQTPSGHNASLLSSRGAAAVALGLIGGLSLAASGCDTVAQISFTQSGFNEIHSSGFVPAGGGFDGSVDACNATGGDMTMRFVMTDDSRRPIRLGVDQIENVTVELDNDSVNFDQGALFEISQAETEVGGVTRVREDLSCTTEEGCESPAFGCGTAPTIPQEEQYNACFTGGSVSLSGGGGSKVDFVSDLESSKLFGIAYEVSGSVVGSQPTLSDNSTYFPTGGANIYWDQDGDGSGDVIVSPEVSNDELASDDDEIRVSAVGPMQTSYVITRGLVSEEGRQMAFAGWHFNQDAPQTTRPAGSDSEQSWFVSQTAVQSTMQELRQDISGFSDFAGTHAEVYDAAANVIEDNYSDDAIREIPRGESMLEQGVDKILVLVVDGPDDTRDSVDQVIEAAREHDVRVFVVHYDTGFTENAIEQMYDVPEYMVTQIQEGFTCSDDSDCKNFEICRKFRGFSSSQGGDTKGVPEDQFCFPQRSTDGRIGPIQDYSKLGCATGGGYTYLRSNRALSRAIGWLPYATEGLWEVEAASDQIEDLAGGQGLLLQALFDVTVSGTNKTYQFSQVGGRTSGQSDATVAETDTRSAIFTAE